MKKKITNELVRLTPLIEVCANNLIIFLLLGKTHLGFFG